MKRLFLSISFVCAASISLFAQHDHGSHQKQQDHGGVLKPAPPAAVRPTGEQSMGRLLSLYYNLKNALVSGDEATASLNADLFVRTVNMVDYKILSEGNSHILARDAGKIAVTRDLEKQRQYFALLSSGMVTIAKALTLTKDPVHVLYCPMKRAWWLSSGKEIRNPYYGSSMLTCGEVKETL